MNRGAQMAGASRGRARGRVQPNADSTAASISSMTLSDDMSISSVVPVAGSVMSSRPAARDDASRAEEVKKTGSASSSGKGIRKTIKDGFNKVGATGETMHVVTNYLYMNKSPEFHLHQYRVDFEPDEDSTQLKKLLLRSKESELPSFIFDGHMLYTTKPIPMEKRELKSENKDKTATFNIFIKTVGYVLPDSPMYVQFYNMVMRKCMTLLEMEELGRHFYNRHAAVKIPQEKMQLWPGIVTAIRNHELGMLLCIEITHKVLRMSTVLELIESLKPRCRNPADFAALVKKELVGSIVMTHYNRRTYKVDDVEFSMTPSSTFTTEKYGTLSYEEYYMMRYDVRDLNIKQPLLVSFPKKKDANQGLNDNIYLIPQLCNPTGLTDEMRKDFALMKKLSEHLHMNPEKRMEKLKEFVGKIAHDEKVREEFAKWDINFVPDYIMATARKFPSEKIFMGPVDSDPVATDHTADWTRQLKGRGLLAPVPFSNWILFLPANAAAFAENLIEKMKIEGKKILVDCDRPVHIVTYDNRNPAETIRKELDRRGDSVKFGFIVLPNNGLKLYAEVKKLFVLDYGIGCQCFLLKNMNRNDPKSTQKLGSICSKVMIQVTAKLGGIPWGVKIPVRGLMVLGFDVYHCSERKKQSAGALVSTTDQALNKYFSSVAFHEDKSELATHIVTGMRRALEAYMVENNGQVPDRVVMFRDGVGEGQINFVLDYEVPRLQLAIETVCKDRRQPVSKLAVIIVTKKINSRAMLQKKMGDGKYYYSNLHPGTVIDNTFTLPERYDYFLVSQSVNQGTVSPTNYNVIHDDSSFSPDHMQKLSFKLCHLYYNWCGTVAVPAPCQYAHKLAYLTGIALNNEAPEQLAKNLWYL